MKFEDFITSYKSKNERQIDYIKTLISRTYIPIEEKDTRATMIVDNSYYDDERNFKINSTAKYIFTFLTIVDLYTAIEINYKNSVEEYNELDESGALRDIMSVINKTDLDEFKEILKMKCEDIIMNEYDIHNYISKQVERFSSLFATIVGPVLETIDIDKIQQIMNTVVENKEE